MKIPQRYMVVFRATTILDHSKRLSVKAVGGLAVKGLPLIMLSLERSQSLGAKHSRHFPSTHF